MHGLMMLPEPDLIPALVELRRVTKPGGWLRVSVPDIPTAVEAWASGSLLWFPLMADDVDEAFCRYVTQGGATRSIFTAYRLAHLLAKAGWAGVTEESYQSTMTTCRGITDLDSRPDESIFMEARKPA
jgi:ubiquinone/menaquinone biosynthesis C-methylase UbiE